MLTRLPFLPFPLLSRPPRSFPSRLSLNSRVNSFPGFFAKSVHSGRCALQSQFIHRFHAATLSLSLPAPTQPPTAWLLKPLDMRTCCRDGLSNLAVKRGAPGSGSSAPRPCRPNNGIGGANSMSTHVVIGCRRFITSSYFSFLCLELEVVLVTTTLIEANPPKKTPTTSR